VRGTDIVRELLEKEQDKVVETPEANQGFQTVKEYVSVEIDNDEDDTDGSSKLGPENDDQNTVALDVAQIVLPLISPGIAGVRLFRVEEASSSSTQKAELQLMGNRRSHTKKTLQSSGDVYTKPFFSCAGESQPWTGQSVLIRITFLSEFQRINTL
jgi:hypothetical protein